VEPVPSVEQDLVEKAVRPPALCPEGDGDRLPEIVQLPVGKEKNQFLQQQNCKKATGKLIFKQFNLK
jgi:hypothetical protein